MQPYVGEIRMFAGNFAPPGWALCNGQMISIAENMTLYSLISGIYGPSNADSFQLPDLRGRTPIHAGQGNGLSNRTLGEQLGVERVPLDETQIPPHTHQVPASSQTADQSSPKGNIWAANSSDDLCYANTAPLGSMAPTAISLSGSGIPHENMMPFQAVSFIIALEGIYPPQN